ncbi:MAG: hypothetical protein H6577_09580 [Lewinellaceae bacterium]|nr:hypothetical protein [Saprospiraceae bacterium]MCB9338367.1 hypothetical protein [Lewinellaceae bacterium]
MNRFLFFLAISFFFIQCNEPTKAPESQEPAKENGQGINQKSDPAPTLPSVPLALLEKIFKEGTQVDYIFYNYPFTMSMTDKTPLEYSVRHIAEEPAPLKPECKPAGRVTWQINGNIVLEGDFYFSTGCTYFVFYEKQEKKYANYMTEEGVQYFNNQIQQALQMREQQLGGQ